jgi:hypothetical protein
MPSKGMDNPHPCNSTGSYLYLCPCLARAIVQQTLLRSLRAILASLSKESFKQSLANSQRFGHVPILPVQQERFPHKQSRCLSTHRRDFEEWLRQLRPSDKFSTMKRLRGRGCMPIKRSSIELPPSPSRSSKLIGVYSISRIRMRFEPWKSSLTKRMRIPILLCRSPLSKKISQRCSDGLRSMQLWDLLAPSSRIWHGGKKDQQKQRRRAKSITSARPFLPARGTSLPRCTQACGRTEQTRPSVSRSGQERCGAGSRSASQDVNYQKDSSYVVRNWCVDPVIGICIPQ